MNAVVTCGCGDMDAFAKDAFKMLFKDRELPEIIPQNSKKVDFAKWAPYLEAAKKSQTKYAYYLTDNELWDLKKGVRIA